MINNLINRYPSLKECEENIIRAKNALIECYEKDGKLLLAGNGGSHADCDHIVGELMKGFIKKRPLGAKKIEQMKEHCPEIEDSILSGLQGGLPAISLPSITALGSAFANDESAELVYAQSLLALGRKNDVLIAISTSGNSKNVLAAAKTAKAIGIKVIALTGEGGGQLGKISDVLIAVPERETYKIQELHLPIYHCLCAAVEDYFFEE